MERDSVSFNFRSNQIRNRMTQVVVPVSESSFSSGVSEEEDFEIELIRDKNKKLKKDISDRFMSFKHTSRLLMNSDSVDSQSFANLAGLKVKNEGSIDIYPFDLSQTRVEKSENRTRDLSKLLGTLGKLSVKHRRTKSYLQNRLSKIVLLDQEKIRLKDELNDLQDQFRSSKNGCLKSMSCLII